MNKPGAYFQDLLEGVRFKKMELRQKANNMLTQAEVYETIEYDLRSAIDKEDSKKSSAPPHSIDCQCYDCSYFRKHPQCKPSSASGEQT